MTDTTPGTDVAVFDPSQSRFPALFADQEGGNAEIAELLADNFDDEGFSVGDLMRLHVPPGGGRVWELPGGDDDNPVTVPAVEGVLVHRQKTRSMWLKQMGGGEENGPPDCGSDDGVKGIGMFGVGSELHPEGDCETCPMNQWESARPVDGVKQKGKGCKEQLQLWVLQQDAILPTQITLPPTSLRPWKQYMTALLGAGLSVYQVVTRFGLKTESSGGNKYSTVNPSKVRDLVREERDGAKRFGGTIRGLLEKQAAARRDALKEVLADGGDASDVWRSDTAAGEAADTDASAATGKARR